VIAVPIATAVVFLWNFVAAHWAILPNFIWFRRQSGAEE